jgi:spore coat protein U-like protein
VKGQATVSILCALAAVAAGPSAATTATGSFQVTANVVSACAVSASVLNFGSSIDPLSAGTPLDGSSTISVQCTNTTPYAVALNAGGNAGGASNFTARAMRNGSNSMGYQLYIDSARSTVWGDGTASSSTVSGTGSGSTQSLSLYGRVPSLAGAVPGLYSDTVTVTITY